MRWWCCVPVDVCARLAAGVRLHLFVWRRCTVLSVHESILILFGCSLIVWSGDRDTTGSYMRTNYMEMLVCLFVLFSLMFGLGQQQSGLYSVWYICIDFMYKSHNTWKRKCVFFAVIYSPWTLLAEHGRWLCTTVTATKGKPNISQQHDDRMRFIMNEMNEFTISNINTNYISLIHVFKNTFRLAHFQMWPSKKVFVRSLICIRIYVFMNNVICV